MEFPELRKRYWGARILLVHIWNVTDNVIIQYLELHSKRDATGTSRQSFTLSRAYLIPNHNALQKGIRQCTALSDTLVWFVPTFGD
jgi:hypothetical protein